VRESPTKLKARAKGFLKVLQKFKVKLDDEANLNLSRIGSRNFRGFLQRNASLVRVTLMQADLEFEYPQKLEKIIVKADILKWLDAEEAKLKNIALEEYMEKEAETKAAVKLTPGTEFYLTYDEYYNNEDFITETAEAIKLGDSGMLEKALTFDEFAEYHLSPNVFDNDLIELQYKFWETDLEKEQRLKKTWIDMNRRKALGGVDAVSWKEHRDMNDQIVAMTRKLRWQVD